MSDPLIPEGNGKPPFTHEEREGLIPSYIRIVDELNEAQQAHILQARNWAYKRKNKVLTSDYLNNLLNRMFGRVWKWAGKLHHSEKNIGIDADKHDDEKLFRFVRI
jgi:fido (protein-threonine AMPylation protein)